MNCILLAALLFTIAGVGDGILFGMTCEEHPELLSEWSKCVIPHGDLADAISTFLRDVKDHGCKLPPKKVIKFGLEFLKNNTASYLHHPLYKRIPPNNCGNCGRRVRCCKRSKSFLAQGYQSEICSGYSQACMLEPLTANDIATLQEMYPDAVPPTDGCDVSSYVKAELRIVGRGPAFKYVEPLLCQVIGTKFPSVNCRREGNKCSCCCSAYTPSPQNTCVPKETIDETFTCEQPSA